MRTPGIVLLQRRHDFDPAVVILTHSERRPATTKGSGLSSSSLSLALASFSVSPSLAFFVFFHIVLVEFRRFTL